MPVFKNEDNGTWYVMARYVNWKGERKQKCKRGFATKKEAQEWERMFQLQNSSDLDMSFEAFTELYIRDVKNRLKENTWLTKEHIIRTKILPFFGKLKISEISTKEIITWQNEMLAYRDEKKKPYPPQKGGRRSRRGKRRRPPARLPQPFLSCFFSPCSAHLSLFVIFLLRCQRQKLQRLFVFVLMGKGNIQLLFATDADALYHVNERPAV